MRKKQCFYKKRQVTAENDFISINKTYSKQCKNSLYHVWWYLSYGAENKLFYLFIYFIYIFLASRRQSLEAVYRGVAQHGTLPSLAGEE